MSGKIGNDSSAICKLWKSEVLFCGCAEHLYIYSQLNFGFL